jgi:hypothetical protein
MGSMAYPLDISAVLSYGYHRLVRDLFTARNVETLQSRAVFC